MSKGSRASRAVTRAVMQVLEQRVLLASMPQVIRDINLAGVSSDPQSLVDVNGTLFFTASNAATGRELWKSDGTVKGTVLVKDVLPGAEGASPASLVNFNGSLFFNAVGGLWKSDGTEAGTIRVKDVAGGPFTVVNDQLIFPASGNLWKSDGTTAGTVAITNFDTSYDTNYIYHFGNPTVMNGTLFFTSGSLYNGDVGNELWKSDGTAAGTMIVKDVFPGTHLKPDDLGYGSYEVPNSSSPNSLTVVNGSLFFTATGPDFNQSLWKTDGTAAGTVKVKDVEAFALAEFNGGLVFQGSDDPAGHDYELWKSDGTEAGTVRVKDINPGTHTEYGKQVANNSSPFDFVNINGTLFFAATTQDHGGEIWKTDGTSAGTVRVTDINPDSASSSPYLMTKLGETIFFTADDGSHGQELWSFDTHSEVPQRFSDILPGSGSALIDNLTDVAGSLFFTARDDRHGTELWRLKDGLPKRLSDAATGTLGSKPLHLANFNGTLFFSGSSIGSERPDLYEPEEHNYELWKSDGTESGTVLLKEIREGADKGSDPQHFTQVGDTLYFTAVDRENGPRALWKTDGTAAGTVPVKDIAVASELINLNGLLVFAVDEPQEFFPHRELWRSDGTEAGTVMIKDINPDGSGISRYEAFQWGISNGLLYFNADDGATGTEPWKTDGTAAGTVRLKDINTQTSSDGGAYSSFPRHFTDVNGTLFFTASDEVHRTELWKSDGTAAGTVMVKDIWAGTGDEGGSFPNSLTNLNGVLVFSADDGTTRGRELWKSDGTAAGTVLLKDVLPGGDFPGERSSNPDNLIVVNNMLFFTAADRDRGFEIFKSDGTEAGTVVVKDINPAAVAEGAGSSSPTQLIDVNGMLYFTANDGTHGVEIWRSDGTEVGTVLVGDILAGSATSSPEQLTNVDGRLFYVADDGVHGAEIMTGVATIDGTAGADNFVMSISGSNLLVTLNGVTAETILLAEASRIEVRSLAGDDIVDVSAIALPTFIDAGDGNDSVTGGSANDTIASGAGADVVNGGDGDDQITALLGGTINAGAGNDIVHAGSDAEHPAIVVGGDGDDRIFTGDGGDSVYGGAGRDRVYAGNGSDLISGGGGHDGLFGQGGADRLYGGLGIDRLEGQSGNDRLHASDSTVDQIFGGRGTDVALVDEDDELTSIESTG